MLTTQFTKRKNFFKNILLRRSLRYICLDLVFALLKSDVDAHQFGCTSAVTSWDKFWKASSMELSEF